MQCRVGECHQRAAQYPDLSGHSSSDLSCPSTTTKLQSATPSKAISLARTLLSRARISSTPQSSSPTADTMPPKNPSNRAWPSADSTTLIFTSSTHHTAANSAGSKAGRPWRKQRTPESLRALASATTVSLNQQFPSTSPSLVQLKVISYCDRRKTYSRASQLESQTQTCSQPV